MGTSRKCTDDFEKENKENITTSKMELGSENWIHYLKNQCIEVQKSSKKLFHEAKIKDNLNVVTKYFSSHPFLLVGLTILTAIIITPILLFTIFAIINVAIAFSGFIIIEVMLLMIGITVFCCLMCFIITAVAMTGLTFILSSYFVYFSVSLVKKKLYCNNRNNSSVLKRT